MKLIKNYKIFDFVNGIRKNNRGGEIDQGISYACMEISQ
jgi:hypothetical protein